MSHEFDNWDDDTLDDAIREHDYKITWKCPQCDFEYADYPGVNEALDCPDCGVRCQQAGASYV